jgi:hypothetical protein
MQAIENIALLLQHNYISKLEKRYFLLCHVTYEAGSALKSFNVVGIEFRIDLPLICNIIIVTYNNLLLLASNNPFKMITSLK